MTSSTPLFTELEHSKLSLKNRIVMAPMTRSRSPNGVPGDDVIAYYERRAKADVGLIITEGTVVPHPAANGYAGVPYFHSEESLAGWKKVVDAVHAAGGKIAPQLWHVGSVRKPGTPPDATVPGYSPSGLTKAGGKKVCHEMTKEDINDVIEAFAIAAKNAKDIGFDAVEIHGAHGYLIDQFFWHDVNLRDDEYGGSIINRTRFACEIVRAVREAVGEDFPIIFRFSQWKQQDYNYRIAKTEQELRDFLAPISEAGVDVFHCSTRRYWLPEFPDTDSTLNLAGWTKKITGKPTITVGSVGLDNDFSDWSNLSANSSDISPLLERFNNQEFDLVAVGRALIGDPEWASKLKDNEQDNANGFQQAQLGELI